ncbi:hypothetical protein GGQ74_001503 [Desulfobaculum xiamenense]|uniref:Uncharacterized protein n=1 Tax=Desulfobaculum xiamenense TaxID=995050 RepID=A0A846QNL7_9BACT|nr:hypothetical protein [Desulfobaculum xiamenense]NJB67863.1 hypothetical protein [Desulfobaculum xiamenense]
MRWIVSVILSVAFAAGIVLFYQVWMDFRVSQAEIEFLNTEMQNYRRVEKLFAEQEEKVVVVNGLWEQIQQVGLAPDNWLLYPLSIGRTMEWRDLEKLLYLASNDPDKGGYWFRPTALRVTRVVVAPESAEGTAPAQPPAGEKPAAGGPLPKQMYETVMQGEFMIPKNR